MLKNSYKYVLMMFRGDETSLGQFALSVDWEPARECAEFEAVRLGTISGCAAGSVSSIHPVWHPKLGEPYTNGFRVSVKSNGSQETSVNFSSAYFKSFASQASAQLVEKGDLKAGETFCYLVVAFPQEDEQQNWSHLGFTVEEVASVLPLKETRLQLLLDNAEPQGEIVPSEMPLFMPQHVLDEAATLSHEAGAKETGGILVGYLHRDDSMPEVFAEVTAQLPARHTKAELTKLTFTRETWTDVRAAQELRRRNEIMLGWWHSHPAREWCKDCSVESQRVCKMARDFFSAHDHALHRAIFPKAYSIALVVNDVSFAEPSFSLFGWKDGALVPRGFFITAKSEPAEKVVK
ncbi:MAG: Mov34/MPN/PAD-1 family protein [Acidobacteriota bacterium]|nr:Mov34/MPN/PAD-1 family protein [Acidobacteriota bacterium]